MINLPSSSYRASPSLSYQYYLNKVFHLENRKNKTFWGICFLFLYLVDRFTHTHACKLASPLQFALSKIAGPSWSFQSRSDWSLLSQVNITSFEGSLKIHWFHHWGRHHLRLYYRKPHCFCPLLEKRIRAFSVQSQGQPYSGRNSIRVAVFHFDSYS